jgi:aspartate/methionine/tyrosine aminotransferase
MKFSQRVAQIGGAGPAAWALHREAEAAKRRGEDVLVMSVGDPDFATPAPIVERAVAALRAGDTHYTQIVGRLALREAIAADVSGRSGIAATPDNIVVLAGAQNSLFATSLCLFEPGDEVIALDPIYVTYRACIGASGATVVPVEVRPESGFRPDIAAIAAAVTTKTRAILFSTPNNPSGVILTAEELEGIAAIARRHDLWVISDEVYAALTFDAPHVSIATLPGMAERTVTIGSLSKAQAMTGWRCGWVIGPRDLARHLVDLALCMLYGLPGFIQEGALVALTTARDDMDRMRGIYLRRRDLALAELAKAPGLAAMRPASGMFLLVDIRGTGLPTAEFTRGLFDQEGVSLLDASAFGTSARGFVRLSYTVADEQVAEGCQRIVRYAQSLAERKARPGSNF